METGTSETETMDLGITTQVRKKNDAEADEVLIACMGQELAYTRIQ